MNYIYIDTKTGDYGTLHSREKVSKSTGGKLKTNTLEVKLTRETKKRPKNDVNYDSTIRINY